MLQSTWSRLLQRWFLGKFLFFIDFKRSYEKMGSEREIKIKIADIAISLDRDGTDFDLRLGQVYQPFFGDSQPDLIVHVKDNIPDLPPKELIFDSSPVWTLYKHGDRSIIKVFPEERIPFVERMLVFDSELRSVYLYVRPNPMCSPLAFDPLMYPVGELLLVNYLAQGKGTIVHACGIDLKGLGNLFVGDSGAGKVRWRACGIRKGLKY